MTYMARSWNSWGRGFHLKRAFLLCQHAWMPGDQAWWGLSTGVLIHGYLLTLVFLPAWWPQSNETSYMAGWGSKDEYSSNQGDEALPSVTQP